MLDLNSGLVHKSYRVEVVSQLDLSTERRLESMGLIEGSTICILNKKKHGAVIVKVRGIRLAVGQHIAQGIQVQEVTP